jgi:hypothetical protein
LILGDDDFVAQHHGSKVQQELRELSKAHRRSLANGKMGSVLTFQHFL